MQGCMAFSTTTSSTGNDGQENSNKDGGEKIKRGGSILDLKHATESFLYNLLQMRISVYALVRGFK